MPRIISWELVGARGALGRFVKATKEIRTVNRNLARDVGRMMVKALKKHAPVGVHYDINPAGAVTESRPETLKKSINFKTFSRGGFIEIRIYATEHVKYVIYPTRPHWITAKKAKFLRFYWPNAPAPVVEMFPSKVVYFRQVWHPGTVAQPFHERALISLEPGLRKMMNKRVARVKETLEGQ